MTEKSIALAVLNRFVNMLREVEPPINLDSQVSGRVGPWNLLSCHIDHWYGLRGFVIEYYSVHFQRVHCYSLLFKPRYQEVQVCLESFFRAVVCSV